MASPRTELPSHLRSLEAEAIHIFREIVAEALNPVMLYSIGKDLGGHAAFGAKSVFPSKPPFRCSISIRPGSLRK